MTDLVTSAVDRMPADSIGRIQACLDDRAAELVNAYFDYDKGFAADSFDQFGSNSPNRFGRDDLLALNFLDERLPPKAIRWLLSDRGRDEMCPFLEDIDEGAVLGRPGTADDLDAARRARDRLCEQAGIGDVKASKLLARKRPALVPIVDRVVVTVARAAKGTYWGTFETLMANDGATASIQTIKTEAGVPSEVGLLRVLDVAIWMRGSRSKAAYKVRDRFGVPDLPWAPRPSRATGPSSAMHSG